MEKEVYLKFTLPAARRLLSLLDRAPAGPAYGSFDRNFWWYRQKDFSSAIHQQAVLSLCLLYRLGIPENPFFRNPRVLEWISGSLRYSFDLQHRDGSYDEWYPNERGWAGPTAYLLYAQARTCRLLEKELSGDLLDRARDSFRRSTLHLARYEEEHVLANHQALACLALKESEGFGGETAAFDSLWGRFRSSLRSEGWSLEYDGADPGYQTATLSFLARLHRLGARTEEIEQMVERQLDFLQYFFYPNGEFGGCVGSRQTTSVFHFGLEYWGCLFPLGASLALASREALASGAIPGPMDHEDHYFLYRMHELLEAHEAADEIRQPAPPLPRAGEDFSRWFPEAGLLFRKSGDHYLVINAAKGGTFRLFSGSRKKEIFADGGWVLANGGKRFTNAGTAAPNFERNEDSLLISGKAVCLKAPVFNPLTFLLFRIFILAAGRLPGSARKVKSLIRKILMFQRPAKEIHFRRQISVSPSGVRVEDSLWPAAAVKGGDSIRIERNPGYRFIPQSGYFEFAELGYASPFLDSSGLRERADGTSWRWVREYGAD